MNLAAVSKSLYPFEGQYFDRDGFRYHYLDEGSGDPPVEEAFVDFLVSPDEGHPGEDGCQVAQV